MIQPYFKEKKRDHILVQSLKTISMLSLTLTHTCDSARLMDIFYMLLYVLIYFNSIWTLIVPYCYFELSVLLPKFKTTGASFHSHKNFLLEIHLVSKWVSVFIIDLYYIIRP